MVTGLAANSTAHDLNDGGRRWRIKAGVGVVAALFVVTGCAGSATTEPSPASEGNVASYPQPDAETSPPQPASTVSAPPVAPVSANTGLWTYDTGYNEAARHDGPLTDGDCEALASYYWAEMRTLPDPEYLYLTMFNGCLDAATGLSPNLNNPSRYPPGGFPFTDPCADGDIDPWVVIYDGPAGSGDITVAAPCQEFAEEEALQQLPQGSFIIESWRL